MNIVSRAAAIAVLLLAGLPAANAQVHFSAIATLSAPTNGAQFHATTRYGDTPVAIVTTTSSAHSVAITGEPASALLNIQYDLCLTTIVGNSPDDFKSGVIQCDSDGNFTHYANYTGAPGSLTTNYYYAAGSYTSSATSDIYNVNDTTQKGHNSTSASFTVVSP